MQPYCLSDFVNFPTAKFRCGHASHLSNNRNPIGSYRIPIGSLSYRILSGSYRILQDPIGIFYLDPIGSYSVILQDFLQESYEDPYSRSYIHTLLQKQQFRNHVLICLAFSDPLMRLWKSLMPTCQMHPPSHKRIHKARTRSLSDSVISLQFLIISLHTEK